MHVGKAASKHVFSEINITPLTDIFLVLLIIMMVVAPMIHQMRADIKPPVLESSSSSQGLITVEITKEGQFFVNGTQTEENALTQSLEAAKTKLKEGDEKNVMIRADKQTRSGLVMKVLEAARDSSFEKVTVAGEALSKDRQRELTDPLQLPAAEEEFAG